MVFAAGARPEDYVTGYESKLRAAEVEAIGEYLNESDNLVELHVNIEACDEILANLEGVLVKYEKQLGESSRDIAALQKRSEGMKSRVENRKDVAQALGNFVERIVLQPSLIEDIMEGKIMEKDFQRALSLLSDKLAYVAENEDIKVSAAFRDVAVQMERCRIGAVKRCRDFLMSKINEMRSQNSNLQVLQNVILKYANMLAFLRLHGDGVYASIESAYTLIVTSRLLEVFKSYWASIEPLEKAIVPSDLLLGSAPIIASGTQALTNMMNLLNFSSPATPSGSSIYSEQEEVFELGERAHILHNVNESPIFPSASTEKMPFESIFRSVSKLLVDIAAHEYLFCNSFWSRDGSTVFRSIFKPVLDFIHGSLHAVLADLYDPVALLLCIKINREHFLTMSKKRIPALDEHFDAVNLMMWPRLKAILDMHLESIQTPNHTVVEQLADKKADKILAVAKRYASMTASILVLNRQLVDGSLSLNIERLQYAIMNLLLAISREFPKKGKGTIFLIHNFHHIIYVLKSRAGEYVESDHSKGDSMSALTSPGGSSRTMENLGKQVLASFEEAFSRSLDLYIDSAFASHIPQIVNFVRHGEAASARQGSDKAPNMQLDITSASQIAKNFSDNWKRILELLDGEINSNFTGDDIRTLIQKTSHSKLLLLWSRFLELIKTCENGEDLVRRSVSIPSIMYALKST